jgi:hypothetical protein
VNALAEYLLMALPPWIPAADASDNWQTSARERMSAATHGIPSCQSKEHEHF